MYVLRHSRDRYLCYTNSQPASTLATPIKADFWLFCNFLPNSPFFSLFYLSNEVIRLSINFNHIYVLIQLFTPEQTPNTEENYTTKITTLNPLKQPPYL